MNAGPIFSGFTAEPGSRMDTDADADADADVFPAPNPFFTSPIRPQPAFSFTGASDSAIRSHTSANTNPNTNANTNTAARRGSLEHPPPLFIPIPSSPYKPVRSSPLRHLATSLHQPGPDTENSPADSFDCHSPTSSFSAARPAPFSSPIRPTRCANFAGSGSGPVGMPSFLVDRSGRLPGRVPFRERVPFSKREAHLNPFLRQRGADHETIQKTRRAGFLKKLQEDRNRGRAADREDKIINIEHITDKRQQQLEYSRLIASHKPMSDAEMDAFFDIQENGILGRQGGKPAVPADPDEEQMLAELDQRDREELEAYIRIDEERNRTLHRTEPALGDFDIMMDDDDEFGPDSPGFQIGAG